MTIQTQQRKNDQILPLVILLFIPYVLFYTIDLSLTIGGIIGVCCIFILVGKGYSLEELRIKPKLPDKFGIAIIIGGSLVFLICLVLCPVSGLLSLVFLSVWGASSQEFYFRGALQSSLQSSSSIWKANLGQSLFYLSWHLPGVASTTQGVLIRDIFGFLLLFLFGFLLGSISIREKQIWISVVVHISLEAVILLVLMFGLFV